MIVPAGTSPADRENWRLPHVLAPPMRGAGEASRMMVVSDPGRRAIHASVTASAPVEVVGKTAAVARAAAAFIGILSVGPIIMSSSEFG